MTKPKKITLKTVALWQPILAAAVSGLLAGPPRTDGRGQRAKIRIKMKKGQKHFHKLPKCVMIPCEEDGYEIREYRCCTIIDFLAHWGISPWTTSELYKRRGTTLAAIDKMEKFVDNVGENV